MRIITLIIFILLSNLLAQAQLSSVEVRGGASYNRYMHSGYHGMNSYSFSPDISGLLNFRESKKIGFQVGLNYHIKRTELEDILHNISRTQNIGLFKADVKWDFIGIPVLLNIKLSKSKKNSLLTGISIQYLLNSSEQWEKTIYGSIEEGSIEHNLSSYTLSDRMLYAYVLGLQYNFWTLENCKFNINARSIISWNLKSAKYTALNMNLGIAYMLNNNNSK